MNEWKNLSRPGYFGRKRDEKIAALNKAHGEGNWRLVWIVDPLATPPDSLVLEFKDACIQFYERSYTEHFKKYPGELDLVCSYGECIDNAPTNIQSGCDYTKQESFSTHIQDIAVRNVLRVLDRKFEGAPENVLVIRSKDSNGFRFGPGNILYHNVSEITQPSKCPTWAREGSVEDFWQSNKWIQTKEE